MSEKETTRMLCGQIQIQIDHCGAEYGQMRRYLPSNMLNKNYYASSEPVHCIKFLEMYEACQGTYLFLNLI